MNSSERMKERHVKNREQEGKEARKCKTRKRELGGGRERKKEEDQRRLAANELRLKRQRQR